MPFLAGYSRQGTACGNTSYSFPDNASPVPEGTLPSLFGSALVFGVSGTLLVSSDDDTGPLLAVSPPLSPPGATRPPPPPAYP